MDERVIVVTRRLPGVPFEGLAARLRAGDPPPDGQIFGAGLDGREPPCHVN
jgi:hypothetical protein